jgi:hypothetical protein
MTSKRHQSNVIICYYLALKGKDKDKDKHKDKHEDKDKDKDKACKTIKRH